MENFASKIGELLEGNEVSMSIKEIERLLELANLLTSIETLEEVQYQKKIPLDEEINKRLCELKRFYAQYNFELLKKNEKVRSALWFIFHDA